MAVPVLEIIDARKRFGQVLALDGIGLELLAGEIVGLVGPNGAGKTTLLRAAAGLLALDAGAIRCAGARAGSREARRALGYAPEAPAFPPALTVRDLLDYAARLHASAGSRSGLVARALELGRLEEVATRRATQLSRGYGQRLSLALACMGGRRVVLLDETLAGVDPATRHDLKQQLLSLAAQGVAILLASHDLAAVERLATRVAVLRRGRVIRHAAVPSLLSERVLEVVLDGGGPQAWDRLAPQVRALRPTVAGFEVTLAPGQAPEEVLALCRAYRLAVRTSAVRVRSLEEVVLDSLEAV